MRIGMMLRTFDEKGGVGVYSRNLIEEVLRLDRENEYVLFYRSPQHVGHFTRYENVQEIVVRAPNKAFWDQIAIPLACRREKVDLVFHPKFTVPLLAPCKAVMVAHGVGWYLPETAQFFNWIDRQYIRLMMPLYFRKSACVLSVSKLTSDTFQEILNLPAGKIKTVYFGPAGNFRKVKDQTLLDRVRTRYKLPEKFILTLTKQGGDGRKNLGKIFAAYARYCSQATSPHHLVVGGKDCHRFREAYRLPNNGYGKGVCFPGWIDQADLPAVYSLADLYLYPSNLEAFPIPITEAMACGVPVVTSNANGLKEIAGDAALFVNPANEKEISAAIGRVLSDPELQKSLSDSGLNRSKLFSWEKCARETLEILENVHRG